MNIFAVSNNPEEAAKDLPDKLLSKMCLESTQMLAVWGFNSRSIRIPRKDGQPYGVNGHKNHPCTRWLYESDNNVKWLVEHAYALAKEHARRRSMVTGKTSDRHACLRALDSLREQCPDLDRLTWEEHTPFPQAMPDQYKSDNPVSSYREFMMHEKGYAVWQLKDTEPSWWNHEKHRPCREKYLAEQQKKKLQRQNARTLNHSLSRSLQGSQSI